MSFDPSRSGYGWTVGVGFRRWALGRVPGRGCLLVCVLTGRPIPAYRRSDGPRAWHGEGPRGHSGSEPPHPAKGSSQGGMTQGRTFRSNVNASPADGGGRRFVFLQPTPSMRHGPGKQRTRRALIFPSAFMSLGHSLLFIHFFHFFVSEVL